MPKHPKSKLSSLLCVSTTIIIVAAAASGALAQSFPNKPIQVIVPYTAGGTSTMYLNVIAGKLAQSTGAKLVLVYKPGAAGNIGVDAVLKSPADGYTIGSTALNSFSINPHLTKKLPYDIHKDVQPITTIGSVPNLLVVHPSLKANTLRELIAMSKTTDLTYALTTLGSSIHLAAELLISESGLKMRAIPYKGDTAAMQDVLGGGRVPVMISSLPVFIEYVRSGKLRAIAVTSSKRAETLPDVPTLIESGLPNFDVRGHFLLFTARGVPAPVLDWLQRELSKAIDSPDVREAMGKIGLDAKGSSVKDTQALIDSEYKRWGPVVKRLGLSWD